MRLAIVDLPVPLYNRCRNKPEVQQMLRYTARMNYSEDTVYKLTEMQHRTFHGGRRMVMIVVAVVAILAGFYLSLSSMFGLLSFFTGCILLTGLNARPRATAKAFIAQLAGKYPSMKYSFTDYGFSSQQENAETPYSSVLRMVEDGKYYYIYVSTEKAYMVEALSVRSQKGNKDFRDFMCAKTGKKWTRPTTFFNFSINTLRKRK